MLDDGLSSLDQERAQLQEAWVRMERQSADFLQAKRQGESLESLQLRDQDLRQAESEFMMSLFAMQRLRRSMLTTQATIDVTQQAIRRLEEAVGSAEDPLSGTWRLAVEPGGQEGQMSLQLDGTLVQGTYHLSGNWIGSLRGTFVAGKVRLERIDSQIGFAAIFHGRLQGQGKNATLQGNWEATQLAAGMPSSGTWVAHKVTEAPE